MEIEPTMSLRSLLLLLALVALALTLVSAAGWAMRRPSHDRAWQVEQSRLPQVLFQGEEVEIRNLRDFTYGTEGEPRPRYRTERYRLDEVEKVWYGLSYFGGRWRGPAHAFLSFRFRDGRHLAVSVEARREQGEEYSVLGGMLRRFEVIYVLGTEEDIVGLRAAIWRDPTYLYPVRATPEQTRRLLSGLLLRTEEVRRSPRFYHTLTDNCITALIREINHLAEEKIGFSRAVLLPGYSDELAFQRGLLDTSLSLPEARQRHQVNALAIEAYGKPDFSGRIRVE